MTKKSKYNCAFCLTPISPGHWQSQNGKCQRCNFYFPEAMPFQNVCTEFGCTEFAEIGKDHCVEHGKKFLYPVPSKKEVDEAIDSNDIYREVKEAILDAQRSQVSYGMQKYPELLNPLSWDMVEAIEHKIQEQIDALHYTVMHKHQLMKYLKENDIKKGKA